MGGQLERQMAGLRQGNHVCLIYKDAAERNAATVALVEIGLARGERCVCVVDEQAAAEIAGELAARIDVGREKERGALLFVGREACLSRGEFDPETAVRFLKDAAEVAASGCFSGLRLVHDVTWDLESAAGRERVVEYERQLNALLPGSRVLAICQHAWGRRQLEAVPDLLRTHPVVILGGQVCANPYCEPPDLVAGTGSDANRGEWMIAQLKRAKAAEQALLQGEMELRRAQRLETARRIARQVAHDFNNLLAPMIGYPELIKMDLPEGHPSAQFCDAMMEAAQSLTRVTDELMALAGKAHFDAEPVNLNRVVEQAVAWLRTEAGHPRVHLDLADDLRPIAGSPAQLARTVGNLLRNASEATPDEGLISVRTENVSADHAIGRWTRIEPGEYVRLAVTDTGSGISPEVQEQVFDAFFTTRRATKGRGAGLGLSIVQAIVSDHQGYVDLETEVGQGTTFSVYFPVRVGHSG